MNRAFLVFALACCATSMVHAGTYMFASETNGIDLVAHPRVYTGAGGALANLTVCIDTSVNPILAAQAEASVINAVSTYNRLRSIPAHNLAFFTDTDFASNKTDFESTVLHEMGHCQGLGHPNHATESGLSDPSRNGTKSTDGVDNVFDQAAGVDTKHGSSDDVRDDDVNLHWYIKNQNNPGLLPVVFDSSTMIRALTALPLGHLYAANADRDVMALLGFADTEAVMQQGAFNSEAQRHLQHDDVTTLRLARSGLDLIQGTADDYTYQLEYVGQLNNPSSANCNLRVRIDNSTSFAVCSTNGSFINATNIRITTANLAFNNATNWHFSAGPNTVTTIISDSPDPSTEVQTYSVRVTVREADGISIDGEPSGTVEVTDDAGMTCTITLAGTVNEEGTCTLTSTAIGTRTLTAQFLGFAGWDASSGTATHEVLDEIIFQDGFDG